MIRGLLEIESKFDVDPEALLPDLDALPGVMSTELCAPVELVAEYFDSDDLVLLHAGITLRRRTGGADAGWHLKLPVSPDRFEIQLPLGAASPPEALVAVLRGVLRDRPLQEVARICTHRTVTRLLDQEGRRLGEVCDDRVEAHSRPPRPRVAVSWREWELELSRPLPDLAAAASLAFGRTGATASTSGSKLRRTLAASGWEPKPETHQDRCFTVADVVERQLRRAAKDLRRLDPLVRADVPDAVHQMRVTCRRLRAVLRAYARHLDSTAVAAVVPELRWLVEALGRPRDLEVIRALIGRIVDQPETSGAMSTRLVAAHEDAHVAVRGVMGSPRYFALLDDTLALAEDPPWTAHAQGRAKHELRRTLRGELRRVARRASRAEAAPERERAEELHAVRKAARRARYAVEAAVPLLGSPARRLSGALTGVQDALGDGHDLVVARAELLEATGDPVVTRAALRRFDAEARLVDRRYRRALRRVFSDERCGWLLRHPKRLRP